MSPPCSSFFFNNLFRSPLFKRLSTDKENKPPASSVFSLPNETNPKPPALTDPFCPLFTHYAGLLLSRTTDQGNRSHHLLLSPVVYQLCKPATNNRTTTFFLLSSLLTATEHKCLSPVTPVVFTGTSTTTTADRNTTPTPSTAVTTLETAILSRCNSVSFCCVCPATKGYTLSRNRLSNRRLLPHEP
ncbi:hypothetical protein HanRHA438_Chr04g0189521 [Helianthus annuus]|nr:hypothetical protein HanRHA438_Chr04g0189521 [Helianthus annuus]